MTDNSIEKRMLGSVCSAADKDFIDHMRHAVASSVGYGFMQQVIEWEWQDHHAHSWGPEYFEAEIKRLTIEVSIMREALEEMVAACKPVHDKSVITISHIGLKALERVPDSLAPGEDDE